MYSTVGSRKVRKTELHIGVYSILIYTHAL